MCLLFLWQWSRTCVCLPAWNTWQSCVVPLAIIIIIIIMFIIIIIFTSAKKVVVLLCLCFTLSKHDSKSCGRILMKMLRDGRCDWRNGAASRHDVDAGICYRFFTTAMYDKCWIILYLRAFRDLDGSLHSQSTSNSLHCALAAAQCIVIGPVCVGFVAVFVCLLPR